MDANKKKVIIEKDVLAESILIALISPIPIGGPAAVELMFGYRGRLKQKRLNQFTEKLENELKGLKINVDDEKTEIFSDLYEVCASRAIQTRSAKKMELFKNIIVNHVKHDTDFDISIGFAELISSLSEKEFEVLVGHKELDTDFYSLYFDAKKAEKRINKFKENDWQGLGLKSLAELKTLRGEIENLEQKNHKNIEKVNILEAKREAASYNIEDDYLLFCKQSLFAKGLLKDVGIGRIGVSPFEYMCITEYGSTFIQYVLS